MSVTWLCVVPEAVCVDLESASAMAHTIHGLYYTAFFEWIGPYITFQRGPRATGHVSKYDN